MLTSQEVTLPPWKVAKDIGERIAELRKALGGISQKEFAEMVGVYPPQVSNWETGKQKPPRRKLEEWSKRFQWRREIFAEAGPRPSEAVNRPVNASVLREPMSGRYGVGSLAQTPEAAIRAGVIQRLESRVYAAGEAVSRETAISLIREMGEAWFQAELRRSGVAESDAGQQVS